MRHDVTTMLPLKGSQSIKMGRARKISAWIVVHLNNCRAEGIRVQSKGRP